MLLILQSAYTRGNQYPHNSWNDLIISCDCCEASNNQDLSFLTSGVSSTWVGTCLDKCSRMTGTSELHVILHASFDAWLQRNLWTNVSPYIRVSTLNWVVLPYLFTTQVTYNNSCLHGISAVIVLKADHMYNKQVDSLLSKKARRP